MNGSYKGYSKSELDVILNTPWEISDQPYKLHAAYALSCLYDVVAPMDDDEENPFRREDMFGCRIPKHIFDRLLQGISSEFYDAIENGARVPVFGKQYSIRNKKTLKLEILPYIFNFKLDGDEYIINKDGVQNLDSFKQDTHDDTQTKKSELAENRSYLRQVIMMAEDDKNNGWDKLTDMEILMYCWAYYSNQHDIENMDEFLNENKDYLYAGKNEMLSCMNEPKPSCQKKWGLYAFSAKKVIQWNKDNGQPSVASSIPKQEADDYWYNVAMNGSFKPKT